MIDGVLIHPLKQIPDERGKIMHMLREDDPHFERFGEIYFSQVYPGVIKGWHIHSEMTLNYAVVSGTIKMVLFDERALSPTKGELQEIVMGEGNHILLRVPPDVWNGFKGVGLSASIVANCSTIAHRADEISRLDPFENHIPYDWALQHR